MRNLSLLTAFSFALCSTVSQADTTVLPTGVRAFVYKHVRAKVPSSFGQDGATKDFAIRETLGSSVIKSISSDTASAYEELHKIDSKLAENINLGHIDMEPEINVSANAFGLAWGLTDRIMIAVGVPVMKADVKLKGGYFNTGSVMAAASALKNHSNADAKEKANAMAQVLEQLPTIRGEHLQGVIVNEFGYKPIGHWSGQGIGDTQLFLQAKAYDGDIYDNGAKAGIEIPTGRKDDPDNLVDVPFGTGYFTSFVETIHDVQILQDALMTTLSARYNYAFSTNRTYRLSPSTSFPLTSEKEDIRYKPGNSWIVGAELSTKLWKSIGLSALYSVKNKGKDTIRGARSDYDYSILEHKTDARTDTVEATLSFSTVDLFLRKKFPVPFKVGITAARVVSGRNTERVNQASANFEMYF